MHSEPIEPEGYYLGEKIQVIVEFEQLVAVEGLAPNSPSRSASTSGWPTSLPWVEDDFPPERPSWLQRFEYQVGPDDEDTDGITIQADAFDFSGGGLLTAAGVMVEVEIRAIGPEHKPPTRLAPARPCTPIA